MKNLKNPNQPWLRRFALFLLVCFASAMALAGCGGGEQEPADRGVSTHRRLEGPTGMGMAKLMEMNLPTIPIPSKAPPTPSWRSHTGWRTSPRCPLVTSPPRSTIKTGGDLQVAAVNTLGVLYILSSGDGVKTLADLKGKTIAGAKRAPPPNTFRSIFSPSASAPAPM